MAPGAFAGCAQLYREGLRRDTPEAAATHANSQGGGCRSENQSHYAARVLRAESYCDELGLSSELTTSFVDPPTTSVSTDFQVVPGSCSFSAPSWPMAHSESPTRTKSRRKSKSAVGVATHVWPSALIRSWSSAATHSRLDLSTAMPLSQARIGSPFWSLGGCAFQVVP